MAIVRKRAYPNNSTGSACLAATLLLMLSLVFGCNKKPDESASLNTNNNVARAGTPALDAAPIIERYRALDNSRDSTIKLTASITDKSQTDQALPRQVHLTMYRKRQPDGSSLMLVEFTAPAEERDRDGLITVMPDGTVEGVRYVQSTDSFVSTRDVMSEDGLFGLTLQELADGQPEKYDFTVVGDDTTEGKPVYKLEGKLKPRAESKFPRVVLFISKENSAALKAQFFDNHSELARELIVTKIEQVAGHWTRKNWTIENHLRQRKIDFVVNDASYDRGLKDSLFTREQLKKVSSR